jgi:hypothetical protein
MFVSYDKKSKKAKRADDLAKRVTWGFSPVTRVKSSKKVYNRQQAKRVDYM